MSYKSTIVQEFEDFGSQFDDNGSLPEQCLFRNMLIVTPLWGIVSGAQNLQRNYTVKFTFRENPTELGRAYKKKCQ